MTMHLSPHTFWPSPARFLANTHSAGSTCPSRAGPSKLIPLYHPQREMGSPSPLPAQPEKAPAILTRKMASAGWWVYIKFYRYEFIVVAKRFKNNPPQITHITIKNFLFPFFSWYSVSLEAMPKITERSSMIIKVTISLNRFSWGVPIPALT